MSDRYENSGWEHDAAYIAVVVVTFNNVDVHPSVVAVADNASEDEGVAIAEAATDLPTRIVQLGSNAGSRGHQRRHRPRYHRKLDPVFVMNPDCRPRPDTPHRLAKSLPQRGRAIAVPRLVNPGGSLQASLHRSPTVSRAPAEAVIDGDLADRIGTLGELVVKPREYDDPSQAAWNTGAAMLPSADAIRGLGLWDESFLLCGEETEYCLRTADHDWTLWYKPAALAEQIGGEPGTKSALFAPMVANKVKLFPTHATPPVIEAFSIRRRDGLSSATSAPREARRPARASGAMYRTGSWTTSRSSSARRVRSRPARRGSGRRRCE